jgi:leucyl-tRNA synthetase
MPRYSPATIEPKWQKFWEEHRTFATPRLPQGEKKYVLDMFPYPSGDGLHVGHPEGYTATDIMCRYWRMRGLSIMHPMGFDAFGLPAEEHAIKTNTPPRVQTERNIANFRRQLKSLGFSYDWGRELATTDVEYFRWTQWIFLQIYDTWFDHQQQRGRPISELPIPPEVQAAGEDAVRHYQDEHRLAYQTEAPVNWCPALGTVLANEEVIDGKSERGGHPVVRMPLRQWMLRITAYADRLENDLETLSWSESIKTLQRNWIGRSTGAEVDFYVGWDKAAPAAAGPPTDRSSSFATWKSARSKTGFPKKPPDDVLRIYTTRPDTLFGATYMVIAPEHPFVERLTTPEQAAKVKAYCEEAAGKSDLDRTELAKKKTGVFTGSYAINPVNVEKIPIWIADYVLISYGTGAIMAVPAHDERDFEFAQQFGLKIIPVVDPGKHVDAATRAAVLAGQACFVGDGTAINSEKYDGLPTSEFKQKIAADLAARGLGRQAVNYKLRDWLFSRQRFWGEPFPILHELDESGKPTGMVRALREDELPLDLPHLEDFKPHGRPEPPLEKAPKDWLYPVADGKKYKRETNTMPQWAGSCWYYLRFLDARNSQAFVDPGVERAWMPVDLYVGGAEHAVLHLLYARFWHKVLYDRGHVSTPEPFQRLVNQGMILGEMEITGYQSADGRWVSAAEVASDDEDKPVQKKTREPLRTVRVPAHDAAKQGEGFVLVADPAIRLESRAYKMSKSRGNVVNPDAIVKDYGADALRLYEMFMGPLEAAKPWSMEGVNGVRGFLDRVWRLIVNDRAEANELHAAVKDVPANDEQSRVLHKTIKAVTDDLDAMAFNTAIARMMEFSNYFGKQDARPKRVMEQFVLLLSPFAPHIAEELWQVLGHTQNLAYEPWPAYDEALTRDEVQELPVQINGKVRSKIQVPAGIGQAELEAAARADERVADHLSGKTIVKVIVVPGRLVNFVVKP